MYTTLMIWKNNSKTTSHCYVGYTGRDDKRSLPWWPRAADVCTNTYGYKWVWPASLLGKQRSQHEKYRAPLSNIRTLIVHTYRYYKHNGIKEISEFIYRKKVYLLHMLELKIRVVYRL